MTQHLALGAKERPPKSVRRSFVWKKSNLAEETKFAVR